MGRRELLAALGGAVAAWPVAARAQQPAMPLVGFLRSGALTELHDRVTAFREGLKETAYVEGENIVIESGETA
jgi:putative ABC transport system substrate-binding protein